MRAALGSIGSIALLVTTVMLPLSGCGGSSGPVDGGRAFEHVKALVAIGPRPFGSDALGTWLVLLSPTSVLDGTNGFLFDVPTSGQFDAFVDVPMVSYFVAAAIGIAGSIALSVRRFQGYVA